jgi:hypothetical protein
MSAALMEPFSSSAGSTSSSGASSAHGSTAPAGTIPITRYSGRAQYLHLPRPEAAAPARSAAGTRRTATSRIPLWQDANVGRSHWMACAILTETAPALARSLSKPGKISPSAQRPASRPSGRPSCGVPDREAADAVKRSRSETPTCSKYFAKKGLHREYQSPLLLLSEPLECVFDWITDDPRVIQSCQNGFGNSYPRSSRRRPMSLSM